MIHIIFQHADRLLLEEAMKMDDSMQGGIVEIKDEWGVGPLENLDTEEGCQARKEWWRMLLKESSHSEKLVETFDDTETVQQLMQKLDEDSGEEAWIWMGQNQHDVTGYYWLVSRLKNYAGRIYVLYLNNLPFINEKGQLFYPSNVHEILPREVIKAKKLARPVSLSEFETDPDEWQRLAEENAMVRVLEGGKKITGRSADFYDGEIVKNLTGEWQKATRVISNTLHRMKPKTGDVYLMWRMKQLIGAGKVEVLGDMDAGWKAFDVRRAGKQEQAIMASDQSTA